MTTIFILVIHLSHPGHVIFFARSQWKHLRASTEEESMANTTGNPGPNIFSTIEPSSPWSLFFSVRSFY